MIKIGCFNVKNDVQNYMINKETNADAIAEMINHQKFDLFGMQELTAKYFKELSLRLKDYKFYGKYRYGRLFKGLSYNENNNIITNKKVMFERTIWLPWIANNFKDLKLGVKKKSIMPRIATIVIVEDKDNGKLCMINTHLSSRISSIQLCQLKKLKEIIMKYNKKYPIILTGDFNMEISDKRFSDFIFGIKAFGMKHINIEGNTWQNKSGKAKSFDHIFIPEDWVVKNAGIIDLKNVSDHKAIYVEADIISKAL
jgi:endonuclease/exonuclease/phosphatase family metal-dependent hydrolase